MTAMHKRDLLRKVDSTLDGLLGSLAAQLIIVQSAVQSPMEAIVFVVAGGTAWRGDGATEFVDMINTQLLPLAQLGANHIDMAAQRLIQARDLIDEADAMSHERVQKVISRFSLAKI